MSREQPIHVTATFWKLGAEVWVEAECGMVMLPPDSPMRALILDTALHHDPKLDAWVSELRGGAAGPRVLAVCDDAAETATIGGLPADYQGVRMVAAVWEGRPIHWHVRGEEARALWQGKAIASVRFEGGMSAEPARILEIDGRLWAATSALCMCVDDVPAQVLKQWRKLVLSSGPIVSQARAMLTGPIGERYEPRPDGDGVWIGPARLHAKYHTVVSRRYPGCVWHATGPVAPVFAVLGEKGVAMIAPAPLPVKGGVS